METDTQDQQPSTQTGSEAVLDLAEMRTPSDESTDQQQTDDSQTNSNNAASAQTSHAQLVSNPSMVAAPNGFSHSQANPNFIPLGTLIMYDERDHNDGTVSCQLQYKLPINNILEVINSSTLSGFDLPSFHHWTIKFRKQLTNLNVSIWFKGGHNLGLKINLFTPKPDIDLNSQLGPNQCDLLFSCSYTPNQYIKHQGIWFTVTSGIENWSKKLANLVENYKDNEGEPVMVVLVADIRFTKDSAWDSNVAEGQSQQTGVNATSGTQTVDDDEDTPMDLEPENETTNNDTQNNKFTPSGTQLKEFDLSKLPDPEQINDPMDTSD